MIPTKNISSVCASFAGQSTVLQPRNEHAKADFTCTSTINRTNWVFSSPFSLKFEFNGRVISENGEDVCFDCHSTHVVPFTASLGFIKLYLSSLDHYSWFLVTKLETNKFMFVFASQKLASCKSQKVVMFYFNLIESNAVT